MAIVESVASESRRLRKELGHPVIDADGHLQEFEPALYDAIRDVGGPQVLEKLRTSRLSSLNPTEVGLDEGMTGLWSRQSVEERRHSRTRRPTWWGSPTKNVLDRGSTMFPRLLAERLEELGIDLALLYPSRGLLFPHGVEEDVRRAACRGYNVCYADAFRGLEAKLMPVAVVPMHTPEEAVEELEYAVQVLGYRAAVIPSYVSRPVEELTERFPGIEYSARWLDTYGIDSAYDYDPFWKRCVELGVPLASHSAGFGWPWAGRRSISNFVYNHMGHFADAGEALCKSLFFGGVTRRFPQLRVAFLEGGVAWGARLLCDLVSHWDKRNVGALENVDPANLDVDTLFELFERFGGAWAEHYRAADVQQAFLKLRGPSGSSGTVDPHRTMLDEFAACEIDDPREILDLFVEPFAFGCEADDPMTACAFWDVNPYQARLRAMFGSDIGHWDVVEMNGVLHETGELVEHDVVSPDDLRRFTFSNLARFASDANPAFFAGTAVEAAVAAELKDHE